jgi:hypothetical protein
MSRFPVIMLEKTPPAKRKVTASMKPATNERADPIAIWGGRIITAIELPTPLVLFEYFLASIQ